MKSLQDKMNEMPESRQDTIKRIAAELRDVDAWIEHSKQQAELIMRMFQIMGEHNIDDRYVNARHTTLLMNAPGALGQAMERRNY